jgi:ABC1 atypical kinase-like domain
MVPAVNAIQPMCRSEILCSQLVIFTSLNQDQIPPFSTRVAMKSIESQLGSRVSDIFADISPEPIAAASLGQVYKGIIPWYSQVIIGPMMLKFLNVLYSSNFIFDQLKRHKFTFALYTVIFV